MTTQTFEEWASEVKTRLQALEILANETGEVQTETIRGGTFIQEGGVLSIDSVIITVEPTNESDNLWKLLIEEVERKCADGSLLTAHNQGPKPI